MRAGYSRLQIEPLKVGRDATYFTFDLTQHSVRRFTPLVSAWHYNSVYDMAEKNFLFSDSLADFIVNISVERVNLKLPFGTHTICPVLVVVLQLLDSLKFEISIEFARLI